MDSSVITMLIVSFCLAAVVILKRNSIPEKARRPLAIITLVLVAASFAMFLVSLYRLSE